MKLLNYLFFSMFGSVLESCELTGVCLLLPWLQGLSQPKIFTHRMTIAQAE